MPEFREPRERVPADKSYKKAPRAYVIEYRTKPEKLDVTKESRFLHIPEWRELALRAYLTEAERDQALAKFQRASEAKEGAGAYFEYRGVTRA